MEFVNRPIVKFNRPFFLFNKTTKEVVVVPTIVESGHESVTTIDLMKEDYREANTIEELMPLFDGLGLVMPEENTWDFQERAIQVTIKDVALLSMLKTVPQMISFLDTLKDFIIARNGNQIIYLNELFPEHRALFESFGANIESNG